MEKLVLAIPHSHAWFWLQTCISSLLKNPPRADNLECEIVIVDNSPWSPAIRGIMDTLMDKMLEDGGTKTTIIPNHKTNRFHASALDCVIERFDFDYLMAWETDVLALKPTWLQWFFSNLKTTDFATGHWHHEQFINPSCTLYRGDVLREMMDWCKTKAPQDELRWGPEFSQTAPLDNNLPLSQNPAEVLQGLKNWIGGTFAEKRGWPQGTVLKEQPSGQLKGAGWYEPGQQLHHWAVEAGYTYTVCPTETEFKEPGLPIGTTYGDSQTIHMWGGTRALDILKHPVTCGFVQKWTPFWLQREAELWLKWVPKGIREHTLGLIRQYGWHYKGAGTPEVTDRDREAVAYVQRCYEDGGVSV